MSDLVWLDEPSVFSEEIADGESKLTFDHFDAEANDDIKRALIETGAVEVGIAAEQSLPGQTRAPASSRTTTNWCQYNDTIPTGQPCRDHRGLGRRLSGVQLLRPSGRTRRKRCMACEEQLRLGPNVRRR